MDMSSPNSKSGKGLQLSPDDTSELGNEDIMELDASETIVIKFISGLYSERRLLSRFDSSLASLCNQACIILNHFYPNHAYVNLAANVLLFARALDGDPESLTRLHNVDQLQDAPECSIVIVLSDDAKEATDKLKPHTLHVHSYKTPTFCDYCGQMLFGLVRQGFRCDGCHYNFHKRCAHNVPNNCSGQPEKEGEETCSLDVRRMSVTSEASYQQRRPSASSIAGARRGSEVSIAVSPSPRRSMSEDTAGEDGFSRTASYSLGRPAWIDRALLEMPSERPTVPHRFAVHSFKMPTVCRYCKKMLVGLFRQGLQCKDCKLNVHRGCLKFIADECTSDVLNEVLQQKGPDSLDNRTPAVGSPDLELVISDTTIPSLSEGDAASQTSELPSENIPLQRIFMSQRKSRRVDPEHMLSGWVLYCTSTEKQRQLRFWTLTSRCLSVCETDRRASPKVSVIPLSSFMGICNAAEVKLNNHVFEIEIQSGENKMTYFIGERVSAPEQCSIFKLAAEPPDTVFSAKSQASFMQALKVSLTQKATESWRETLLNAMHPVSGSQAAKVMLSNPEERKKDISSIYQVFPDEVLGSGQFGVVYAGVHRKKGYCIAIKVIDKRRFSSKHEAALKNEVDILQSIKYPGVVHLENMFETPDRIFIVMEKMDSDMLETVLSSPKGRLDERQTRFLIAQILYALQHLHSKMIAHCDLKPENVLLARGPDKKSLQAKLCDFGFSRIIGEKTFRKTMVGTPAYLAPEVVKNKGYNRSLDLWSVGVIIYVTLSGTFPFNEDEDINDQIENAAFMYPNKPWKEISGEAIQLINSLLTVEARKRYSAAKALNHQWLSNKELHDDLRSLEKHVGMRYMTHEAEDEYWSNQGSGKAPEKGKELPEDNVVMPD